MDLVEEFVRGRPMPEVLVDSPDVPCEETQDDLETKAKHLVGPWRPLVSPGGLLQTAVCRQAIHFRNVGFLTGFSDDDVASNLYLLALSNQRPDTSVCFALQA